MLSQVQAAIGAQGTVSLENLFSALPEPVYTTDAEGRISFYNEAAADLWGNRPKIGSTQCGGSCKLFWPDGSPVRHGECPMSVALKEKQLNRGREIIVERPDGRRITVLAFPTPLIDKNGMLLGAVNMLIDVTHRSIAYEETQRFAAIVESSDDAILAKDLNGTIVSWNKGAERLYGYTAEEIIGKPVATLIPLERHDEEPNILSRIRAGEKIDHYETIRRRKDGSLIEISLSVSPIRNREGRIVGAAKIARDITERRRAEEQQHLLLKEMDHRIKNLFMLANSVVSLSSRSATSARDLASAVASRLNALAEAHALTVPRASQTTGRIEREATLHALIRKIAAPYDNVTRSGGSRIAVSGADAVLTGNAVTSFALLLHEFATNAAKYGALSVPDGTIDIRCHEDDEWLVLNWVERGGPPVDRTEDGSGFGTLLGRATVQAQLGGTIVREWSPQGLTIRLSVARDRLGPQGRQEEE